MQDAAGLIRRSGCRVPRVDFRQEQPPTRDLERTLALSRELEAALMPHVGRRRACERDGERVLGGGT